MKNTLLFAVLTLFSLSVTGCSFLNSLFQKPDLSPDQLMIEGMEDFEKGRYQSATEAFQKIKDMYPYSKYAVEAELRLADALYKRESYFEAYDAYDEFERLHPRNENIPYVVYQKGMTHFSRMRTIDRDQSSVLKAKEEFERLIRRYPGTEYANRAQKKLRECYISLAEHELYVANYYFKRGNYRASRDRYLFLLENYPDLGQYHEVLEKLKESKKRLAEKD